MKNSRQKERRGYALSMMRNLIQGIRCEGREQRELRIFFVRENNVEEEIIKEDCYEQKELNTQLRWKRKLSQ